MRLTHSISVLGLAALCAAGQQPPASTRPAVDASAKEPLTEAQLATQADALVSAETERGAFSGTVLLARDGKVVFEKAYGFASREFKVPNRLGTRFNLGSINKVFTRIAVAQLAAEGKVGFDDPLGKYLPDYPNADARGKVTIRHLIDMRGGIPDFFGPEFEAMDKGRLRTLEDYLPLFASKPLAFEPGERMQYSNGGYLLLGLVIQKASGQDYFSYVRDHIFKPAGMKDSDWFESDAIVPDLAEGYTRPEKAGGPLLNNRLTRPAKGSSAGGGYATAEDLLRFSEALRAGRLLPPGLTAWMLGGMTRTPADAHPPVPSGPTIGLAMAGGAPGINAMIRLDGATTAVVLSNGEPPMAMDTMKRLEDLWHRVPGWGSAAGQLVKQ